MEVATKEPLSAAEEKERIAPTARFTAPDVVRVIACVCVPSLHFLLHSGFYALPVTEGPAFIMLGMRTVFMCSVPLFVLLTGWLMVNKTPARDYYAKGNKTLFTYLAASLVCILFKILYQHTPVLKTLMGLFDFTGANYAWYMEMYFGLFLLIPFLNVLFLNLPSRKWQRAFLITLLLLTAAPTAVNVYDLFSAEFWANPTAAEGFTQLIPAWWKNIWPLTYYYIGAYLRKYPLKLDGLAGALLLAAVGLFTTVYNYWRCAKGAFTGGPWTDWGSLFNVTFAALLFALLIRCPFRRMPEWLRKVLARFSAWSLGIYLISFIFDTLYYEKLNAWVPEATDRLRWFPVIVPAVLLSSAAASAVLDGLYTLIRRSYRKRKTKKTGFSRESEKSGV